MRIRATGLLAFSLLAGCAETDPYQRMGLWNPLGANDANLRAMVADPRDLELGQGGARGAGDMGAAAVARLRTDTVRRLPASSISKVQPADAGAATEGGSGAATPAAPVAAPAGGGSP